MRVNAHLSVQMSPHRPGEANPCYILDLVALQKNFMFMCSLFSERTTFTCWLVYQPWSVFCLSSLAAKVLDASHHRTCTKMFARPSSHPFLYFNISFCWRTSAFYDWSNILFILSDLYAFRYLVITPCLKKKRAYWKKIKQLWFLKCTVLFSDICLKYVSLPTSKLQTWSKSGILRTNNGRSD